MFRNGSNTPFYFKILMESKKCKNEKNMMTNVEETVFSSANVSSPTAMDVFPLKIRGPRSMNEVNLTSDLITSYQTIGIQASKIYEATEIINEMIELRKMRKIENKEFETHIKHAERCCLNACTIFFGYTSNMISSGIREIVCHLAKHNMIDCLVTSAGGIEEDFIKCLDNFKLGSFDLDGVSLRESHINRIGNIMAPNSGYCKFENWLTPILDEMLKLQIENGISWTPSKLIRLLGERIDDPTSVYYWAFKNGIPVFCPAITDGSLGDIIYKNEVKLKLDIVADQVELNNMAVFAQKTGMIILGGGVPKHQIFNANLMRNGGDYCVLVNTGLEHDASDSGASINEAKSWGKVKANARSVKVFCDASIAFPLIAANTFFKS